MINESGDKVISSQITDKEPLNQFKEVEKLNQEENTWLNPLLMPS